MTKKLSLLLVTFLMIGSAHADDQGAHHHDKAEDNSTHHHANEADHTKAVVKKIKGDKVTLRHEALESLGMPAMTMVFRVGDEAMLDDLEPGAEIEFIAERIKGKLTITNIK